MPRDIMASLPAQQMQILDRRKSSPSSSSRHTPNAMRMSVDTSDADDSDVDNRRLFHESTSATAPTTTPNTPHHVPSSLLRQRNTSKRSPFSVLNNVSLSLENTGSVARDHLANERTYLAWLRTSLSFASIGVAVAQLFSLNQAIGGGGGTSNGSEMLRRFGQPLGATFIGVAIIVLLLGVKRYFSAQSWMTHGKFPASRGSVGLLSAIALLVRFQHCCMAKFLTVYQSLLLPHSPLSSS